MPDFLDYRDSTIPLPPRARCKTSRKRDYADLRNPQPGDDPNSGRFSVVPPLAVEALLQAIAKADQDDALEIVYERVDAMLRAGSFTDVDALLAAVNVEAMHTIVSLAFVSITNSARDVLRTRADFVGRVRRHFEKTEPDRVEELLAGLE